MFLGGMIALLIGLAILHVHPNWNNDWTSLVTLIGWIACIKGITFFIFPDSIQSFKGMLQDKYHGIITTFIIVLGLIFGYFGFFK